MKITIVCCDSSTRMAQIIRTIKILNSVQNYFYFTLETRKEDICVTEEVNWNKFCNEYSMDDDKYKIYITQKAFDDNWFSHEHYRYAVITTYGWEEDFAPPSLSAYIAYQVAQEVIGFNTDLNEEMAIRLGHNKAQGCIFDFCGNKSDIKYGMATGSICPTCRSGLMQFGIDEKVINAVEKVLLYVRSETIGKPVILDENRAFVIMEFSSNDENDNAYKHGIMEALHKLNIECIRADNRVVSGQLLQKVKEYIEKSRFIIAKVDSDNLNVYFELGLAMGLNKDVLLISEQGLVIHLPSDLRNWECLTYSKGDYEGLRDSIVRYYQDNYYY